MKRSRWWSGHCRACWCLLLCLLLLSGCGARFWYNRADWLIGWWMDDYVHFTPEQQRFFDARLAAHLRWHREHELPRYEAFLHDLQTDLDGVMTAEMMQAHMEQVWDFWRTFVGEALPDIEVLFLGLTPAQIDDLLANIEHRQRDFKREYGALDAEALRKKRIVDMERSLRWWIGRLGDAQEEAIERWAGSLPNIYPELVSEQQRWLNALRETFDRRQNRERFNQSLETLLVRSESLWSESYRCHWQANRQQTLELLVNIQASLSVRQREHLHHKLEQLRSDMRSLETQSRTENADGRGGAGGDFPQSTVQKERPCRN